MLPACECMPSGQPNHAAHEVYYGKIQQVGFVGKLQYFHAAVAEQVSIGAAVGADCELCFKYHYSQASKLGVSRDDMAKVVELADRVKRAPVQNMRMLADKLLGTTIASQMPVDSHPGCCCSSALKTLKGSKKTTLKKYK